MAEISIAEFRSNLAEFVNRVQYAGDRFCITRNGRPAAAIISAEDLELLEAVEDYFDGLEAEEAMKEALEKGFISWATYLEEEVR
ncbi:hypothetical protein BH23CHL2_BH23CHL2_14090 [soil metagenome]